MACHCLIRHAVTPAERARAKATLAAARKAGDDVGIRAYVAILGPCPGERADSPENGAPAGMVHVRATMGLRYMLAYLRKAVGPGTTASDIIRSSIVYLYGETVEARGPIAQKVTREESLVFHLPASPEGGAFLCGANKGRLAFSTRVTCPECLRRSEKKGG